MIDDGTIPKVDINHVEDDADMCRDWIKIDSQRYLWWACRMLKELLLMFSISYFFAMIFKIFLDF